MTALPDDEKSLVLLHNPRCSKSRAALKLLEEKGARFEIRLYLDEPLSLAELEDLEGRLGRSAAEWTRSAEKAYAEAGLSRDSDAAALRAAMAATPILMERPILVRGTRAVVGRPPEAILELLGS